LRSGLAGFQLDDAVKFYNPKNTKRVKFNWKEHHIGVTFTYTEAKVDGILMGNGSSSAIPDAGGGRKLSGRDQHVLVNMIQEKLEAMDLKTLLPFEKKYDSDRNIKFKMS
jgi:hypothetical protein